MTKEQFGRGLQLINSITTNQIDSDASIDVYYMLLGDLNGEQYLKGIIELLKTKKNMYTPPSPAEIIEFYNQQMDKSLNIENILDYIKRDILMSGKRHKPKYKKNIMNAINKLGGWEYICGLENMEYLEKNFKKEYKLLEEKKMLELENKA